MQEEKRILELLSEGLQKQDRQSGELADFRSAVEGRFDMVEGRLERVQGVLGQVVENQMAHQQILKVLATNMQNMQKGLSAIFELLDTITRMQRDQNRRLDRLENPDVAA